MRAVPAAARHCVALQATARLTACYFPAVQLLQWHKRRHAPVDGCRLWRVAPQSTAAPQYLVAKAVASPRPTSLDPRGAFVLQGPASLAVWVGAACPEPFVAAAHRFAQQLQRYEGAPGPALVVRLGQEPEVFWASLAAAASEGSGSRAGSPAAPGSAAAANAAAAAAELVAAAAAGPVAVAESSAYDKDFEVSGFTWAFLHRVFGSGGLLQALWLSCWFADLLAVLRYDSGIVPPSCCQPGLQLPASYLAPLSLFLLRAAAVCALTDGPHQRRQRRQRAQRRAQNAA